MMKKFILLYQSIILGIEKQLQNYLCKIHSVIMKIKRLLKLITAFTYANEKNLISCDLGRINYNKNVNRLSR